MSELFYALALLACPVGMGAMMWFMMRGSNQSAGKPSVNAGGDDDMTRLRAEVDQLRAAQRDETAAGSTSATEPQFPR